MCIVCDHQAHLHLQEQFSHHQPTILAFAIGGQYRDPLDPRGRSDQYSGVKLFGLREHEYGEHAKWSNLQFIELRHLIRGDHEGQIEGRKKCVRVSDGLGISEFDGQSAMTFWKNK